MAPPANELWGDFFRVDTLLHLIVYAGLAFFPLLGEIKQQRVRVFLMLLTVHAVALEAIQMLIPGRYGSIGDVIANLLGILLAFVLNRLYKH